MEILILLVILIVAVAIIWTRTKGKPAKSETSISDSHLKFSAPTTSSSGIDNSKKSSAMASPDEGWILNPMGTFPLTISGIDRSTAEEIKRLLDEGQSQHIYAQARTLVPLVARSNIHCKEIDEYISKFKPQYLGKLEELKRSSSEWTSASEKDREDLLIGFRQEAIQSVDIRPYCDLEALFECEPADISIDDDLIDRFGYDNLKVCLRYAGNLNKVRNITADHYERAVFEKLVELGLAIRGMDIPLPSILETLTLKQMNELVADLNQPLFKRKSKAIESLIALPDIKERVGRIVAFRELFKLKPLPSEFSHIDLSQISNAWRYANEIATLIAHTYAMSQNRYQNPDLDSFITGWELSPIGDGATCSYCTRAATKAYPKNKRLNAPLHIGCRCNVLPKTAV